MTQRSHYPAFDVMDEQDAWDDHTQTIVASRVKPKQDISFLTPDEAEMIKRICSILVNDSTAEALDYVVGHIDKTLQHSPGESQRKAGTPEARTLVRAGLNAIEQGVQSLYKSRFLSLEFDAQKRYLKQISENDAGPRQAWGAIPQKEWFQKILNLTVESYCSHPSVWSEIGYAGPAYPRGYVRTQIGQLDPWEAQPER